MTSPPVTTDGWQRLDPRMLLIYPVKELIRFLPVLLGLLVAGTASGGLGDWWHGLGVAIPVGLGVLRYYTTAYRVSAERVELRRGLLNRHVLSTPVDRIRTVDITAPPVHRLLGLTSVRVGTGTASTSEDERLDLDGLPAERARRLRTDLLLTGPGPVDEAHPETSPHTDRAVFVLDPRWVRFAPLTSAGLVIAAGVLGGLAQLVNVSGGFERLDTRRVVDDVTAWSVWLAVPLGLSALAAAVGVLSIAGYLTTNWGFTLSHSAGAWHLRRGLLTTRETALDDERVRGVTLAEPIGLRLAGGARASAIVTGLDQRRAGSSVLVPPAPRAEVERIAGEVLGSRRAVDVPLTGHGPRARARRFTRAVGAAVAVLTVTLALVLLTGLPAWTLAIAALGLPVATALAADRSRSLGHAFVDGNVVARSGSLDRRREMLEAGGVIGWTFHATWFQRRAGLTSLVATTAGGRQSITVLDVPEDDALDLACAALPDLLDQFVSQRGRPSSADRVGL